MGYEDASQDIDGDGVVRMQRMIIYSAAVGIEKGFSHNVIYIHYHGGKKNKIIPLPVFLIIPVRNETDEDEVEEVMGEGLEHFIPVVSYQLSVKKLSFFENQDIFHALTIHCPLSTFH